MIKTNSWTCGNIAVSATLTLPDGTPEYVAKLASNGLTQDLQRKPSSAWEKAEAGYEKKRPEGFKRTDIPFSEKSAANLVDAFIKALGDSAVHVSFTVGEHVAGEEAGTSKEAEKLWTDVQAKPADKFEANLKVLGLDEDYDDEKGIAACHKFLLQVKRDAAAAAKAKAASALG